MPLPALLSIQSGFSKLRYATLMGIKKAKSKEIKRVTLSELGAAATATAAYLATHVRHAGVVAQATVHGFAVASWWAAGSLVLAAVVTGILIDAHPGQERRQADLVIGTPGKAVSAMADG